MVQVVRHWRHYLFHREFILYTDHDALKHLYCQDKVLNFLVHDGFLFKGNQLCVPGCSLRLCIIQELHEEGHVSRDHTFQLVRDSYFWPIIRKEVKRFVEHCRVCLVSKVKQLTLSYICLYLY